MTDSRTAWSPREPLKDAITDLFDRKTGPYTLSMSIDGHPVGRPWDHEWVIKRIKDNADGDTTVIFRDCVDFPVTGDPFIEMTWVTDWSRRWKDDDLKSILVTCGAGCLNCGNISREWGRPVVVDFYRRI